jgi:thiol:disulfide interchange protein DsbD
MMRRATVLLVAAAALAVAQKLNPVQWSLEPEQPKVAPGSTVRLRLTARLDPGWHIYSMTTPRPPIATTISLTENSLTSGSEVYQPKPVRKLDPNFQSETETFEGTVVFLIDAATSKGAPAGPAEITAQMRYQLCDATRCLPPVRRTAAATLSIDPGSPSSVLPVPAGYVRFDPSAPVQAAPSPAPAATRELGPFLALAFGFGLAAIFTPCVFPMIPITMSFFLSRQDDTRKNAVTQALVFCVGIVVLFSLLGLAVTALLGPFGIVLIGSNPWVNGFIVAVFFALGLSLLGAFEITIPSSLLTRLDRASQRGGMLGPLLMGLTFSLTSFACVGPFVGTLLAASVQGGKVQPALGMVAFAAGLASPFFLLAVFPSYLQRLPKSGVWLARVKVVFGFLILAAMFKYLSNIDQVLQWNVLTRERFLAAWIVLLALPGLYLLGFLRLEGVKPEEKLGVARLLVASLFLMVSISLIPGLSGARLGEIEAYIPAPAGGFGRTGSATQSVWMKNEYRQALEKGRAESKLIFVNFTGYACTNCHWMKANMFPRPEIADALAQFVLVELYTDGTDEASRLNQEFQERKFQTIAIPFYAILDADERVIATFPRLTRNAQEYLGFLRSGERSRTAALAP